MKIIHVLILTGLCLFFIFFLAQAQTSEKPQQVVVTTNKTTNIIFPQAIVSVDRGSRDILAQKAKGVENILQVKAARDSFPETNLSVVTADGRLRTFLVNYNRTPDNLTVSAVEGNTNKRIAFSDGNFNKAEIQQYAKAALSARASGSIAHDSKAGITFKVWGFYVHNDVIYCSAGIENRTNIGYDIGQMRFFIRDQQKSKRTATQEIEVTPVLAENEVAEVAANRSETIVFALPKFTIPDKQYLAIQLREDNGGRHLEVHIKNRKLIRARLLP
jgi:conjugative transposon TraN protein